MATFIDSVVKEQAIESMPNGNQHHETSHTERVGAAYENTVVLFKSKRRSIGERTPMNNILKFKAYLSQSVY